MYVTYSDICPYQAHYMEGAYLNQVPWQLLAGQAMVESTFDPAAVGAKDEAGLQQLSPAVWERFGQGHLFDPRDNILCGALYVDWLRNVLQQQGKVDWRWILAAYNWGVGRVLDCETWDDVPEHVDTYVRTVLQYATQFLQRWALVHCRAIVGYPTLANRTDWPVLPHLGKTTRGTAVPVLILKGEANGS